MKYAFANFLFFTVIACLAGNASAQKENEIAHAGPLGIYIVTGNILASESYPIKGQTGYRIERKTEGGNDWKVIAEISAPNTKGELERSLLAAIDEVPYSISPGNIALDHIWSRLEKYRELDSLSIFGSMLITRIAVGATYLDRDVKTGSSYDYRVSQIDQNGLSSQSKTQHIVFQSVVAAGETYRIMRKYADSSSAHMLWRKSEKKVPTALFVFRKIGFGDFKKTGLKASFILINDTLAYSVIDTTVSGDIQYSYYLQPVDYYGNFAHSSDTITVHTISARQIRLPDHIHAEVNAAKSSVDLSWRFTDTLHCMGIRIYRGEENGGVFIRIAERSCKYKSFTDLMVIPDKTYIYYLTVLISTGEESGPTAKVFAVTFSNKKPLAPFALTAFAGKDGVHLQWYSAEPNLKGFYLYRGEGFHAKLERVSELIEFKDSVTIYTDTSKILSPKKVYSYSVQALSTSNIEGALSDNTHIQPVGITVPPVPFNFNAIASGNTIKLFWDEMRIEEPSVVGYLIFRREHGSANFEKISSKNLSAVNNNFTDSGVIPGKTYEYYVRTVDAYGGLSNTSMSTSAVIPETLQLKPPAPAAIHGEVTDEGISLSWGEILGGDISGFNLYRHDGDSESKKIAMIPKNSSSYLDTTAKKGNIYGYFLTSYDSLNSESNPSKEVKIKY